METTIIERTIHGIRLAIVDGHKEDSCPVSNTLALLLEHRKLPRFVFAFRGHGNCFVITDQLYLDFKDLGIEKQFTYKIGFSAILKNNGEPVGRHSWIECDGWTINGANGAIGNPILLERDQAYYSRFQMTDIKDVKSNNNGLVFIEKEMEPN